jgi:hypothetical protein
MSHAKFQRRTTSWLIRLIEHTESTKARNICGPDRMSIAILRTIRSSSPSVSGPRCRWDRLAARALSFPTCPYLCLSPCPYYTRCPCGYCRWICRPDYGSLHRPRDLHVRSLHRSCFHHD